MEILHQLYIIAFRSGALGQARGTPWTGRQSGAGLTQRETTISTHL